MHIKSLKVFCDIAGRRSFSRAADENGITQSGASQIVHQLEQRLGAKLIDRSKRPLILTDAGKLYYEGCREIVERLAAVEDQVRALQTQLAGRVQVASIYSVGLSFMQQFVQEFSQRFPKATVKLDYGRPDRIYELVNADIADLGLVSYPKPSRSIAVKIWRNEPMALALAPSHPLAQRRQISISELDGLTAVGFDNNLRIRREVDKALHAGGVSMRVAMEFDNIETLKRAIEIDSGVSILPTPTIRRELNSGSLAMVGFSDLELTRPVGVIYRKGRTLGNTAQRFMDLFLAASEADEPSRKTNADETSPDAEGAASHSYQQTPPQTA